MRLGVTFSEDVPVAQQRRFAGGIEAAGLASLWANDGYGRDPLLLCQAWADATERLLVGVGVAQIPTRTPAQLGKAAVTLQEASGGRFLLGLGVSQPHALERWHGVRSSRPLATARDALAILRAVTSGDTTGHDGVVLSSHDFRLAISPPPPPVPLYLGAMGPKMLELAGAAADGVLLSWESPAAVERVVEVVRRAATAAGRAAPEIAAYVRIAIDEDRRAARRALAREVGSFWQYYGEHFVRQAPDRSASAAADVAARHDVDAIASTLGDDLLLTLGWYGTPHDDLGPFLARYGAAGVDHLIARPLAVGDPVASLRRVTDALHAAAHAPAAVAL